MERLARGSSRCSGPAEGLPPGGNRQRHRNSPQGALTLGWLARPRRNFTYLFPPVVGVLSGFCVAPDFGITVSFKFVGGILGSFSARFSGFSDLQSIP